MLGIFLLLCSSLSLQTLALSKMTLPRTSGRIQRTLDPCVVLMKEMIGEYAELWQERGGIFSLAQGVVYWNPPQAATEAMVAALNEPDNQLHMYGPDEGLLELRTALEDKTARENGLNDHRVMVTVGANQAYTNAVIALVQDDEKCVVFRPFYFNHVMAIQMTLPEKSLVEGPSSDAGIPDLEWLEKLLQSDRSVRMVTIVNPGNPTGTLLSRATLQRAVDLCHEHGCWLVLDCTYEYFVPNSEFDGTFADPHVLHIFSLSKAYALAGYRCGYIAISRQTGDLYNQIMKVQDTIPIAPSRISQIAALGALTAGREWVKDNVTTLDTGRNAILSAMEPMEQIMGGSGAMYVMGKLKEGTDDQQVAMTLVRDFGVAVIPGSFCGFPGWIRVCYSNLPPAKCLEAAERLRAGILHVSTA